MDAALGYDRRDPSKSHHPLVAGVIKLSTAHNVVHWGVGFCALIGVVITFACSPNPLLALVGLFTFHVAGHIYNDGLSKESPLGFIPICVCFTGLGAWGWFLSHEGLSVEGWLLLAYFFLTVLFQISWSGHLKEIGVAERSNILIKMGARIEDGFFIPGCSMIYGVMVKVVNVAVAWVLFLPRFDIGQYVGIARYIWGLTLITAMMILAFLLTLPRRYNRNTELLKMSLMEILTIYLPIPILLAPVDAAVLMLVGVAYFFGMNSVLWGKLYPRV
jgi:4-hydroxybenzoate polyprenyltransferase